MTTAVEAEWDDDTRAWVEGLADHGRELHTGGCGLHTSVIGDPNSHLQITEDYCPACRFLEVYQRKVLDRDTAWEKAHPQAGPGDPRPNDGLHIGLRSATPAEIRAQRRQRRPNSPADDVAPTRAQRPRLNRRG